MVYASMTLEVVISEEDCAAAVPETDRDEKMMTVVSDHVAMVPLALLPATRIGSNHSPSWCLR